MSVARIASRYAKSLIDLANEQGKLERILEDIQSFQAVCAVREFYLLLKSPIIHADKKRRIFAKLFESEFDELTMGFFNIILRKGREEFLPDMAGAFIDQYREIKQITMVSVTTATKLTDEQLSSVREAIARSGTTYPNIEITAKVDPEIVGGFIIEFDDKLYDASVSSQLAEIRRQFS